MSPVAARGAEALIPVEGLTKSATVPIVAQAPVAGVQTPQRSDAVKQLAEGATLAVQGAVNETLQLPREPQQALQAQTDGAVRLPANKRGSPAQSRDPRAQQVQAAPDQLDSTAQAAQAPARVPAAAEQLGSNEAAPPQHGSAAAPAPTAVLLQQGALLPAARTTRDSGVLHEQVSDVAHTLPIRPLAPHLPGARLRSQALMPSQSPALPESSPMPGAQQRESSQQPAPAVTAQPPTAVAPTPAEGSPPARAPRRRRPRRVVFDGVRMRLSTREVAEIFFGETHPTGFGFTEENDEDDDERPDVHLGVTPPAAGARLRSRDAGALSATQSVQ